MTISVVSPSQELFSLWDGETAWEIEMTLLVCTSLAPHSHPLKLVTFLCRNLRGTLEQTAWDWQGRARGRDVEQSVFLAPHTPLLFIDRPH